MGQLSFDFLFLILLGTFFFYGLYVFNRLIALRNRHQTAWSDIDVQLKKRHDLVPSLVSVVKAYAAHEKSTLLKVTEAREKGLSAEGKEPQELAEASLNNQLIKLFALVEAYPDLKADRTFRSLQNDLVDVENNIQQARRYFNAVVRDFNIHLETFPNILIGKLCGFSSQKFFELESLAERMVPGLSFEESKERA